MTYRWMTRWLVLLGLPVALLGLGACGDDDEDTVGPEEDTDVEDVGEGDEDFNDDDYYYDENDLDTFETDDLVGETVTVSAQIDRVIEGQKSFVIGEDVTAGGVLVVTPPDTDVSGVTIEQGAAVQVEGEVVEFAVADVEEDYDPLDLSDDLYTDYEEDNVIVASSISAVPSEDGEGNGDDGGNGDETTTTGS